MAVNVVVLIPAKIAETAQTTQYTSAGLSTIIDKFTATNYSLLPATISVHLVSSGGTAGADNIMVKTKTLQANETYTFPELVGAALGSGDFISTVSGTANAINIRASGRQITA